MKSTHRDDTAIKSYSRRLNILKGQIEGVSKMFDEDTYCINIIDQLNAVRGSLQSMIKELINEHISGCVKNNKDIDESLNEIKELINRIAK